MADSGAPNDDLDFNDGPEDEDLAQNEPEETEAPEDDYSGEDLYDDNPPAGNQTTSRDRSANARIRELIAEKKRTDELLQQVLMNQNRQPAQLPVDDDLSPEERRIRNLEQQLAHTSALSLDRADKSDFRSLQAINPLARKMAAEVEQEVVKLRQQGMNLPREEVFAWLLGKKMMANPPKTKTGTTRSQGSGPRSPSVAGNTQARKGNAKKSTGFSIEEFESQFGDVPI